MQIAIHLNTLSDGEYHPAAQRPIIYYSQKQTVAVADTLSVSITSTRLAILASVQFEECLVILDWRSAQVLFVRRSVSRFDKQHSSIHVGTQGETVYHCGIHR